MIAGLRFRVNDDYSADIYPTGSYHNVDWESAHPCLLGDDFSIFSNKEQDTKTETMCIVIGLDGRYVLRLTETKRYTIRINTSIKNEQIRLPQLQNESNKSLKIDRDKSSIVFQFVNYLGRSKISFQDNTRKRDLVFEVVPDKIDFEDDYVALTEALAARCAELLLDYSGSTSNRFKLSDEDSMTVLEQFIFIRQFCFSENIQSLFEEIKRNPDRQLVEDEEFRPIGCGIPSKRVYSCPLKFARNWNNNTSSSGEHYLVPTAVLVSHKRDSLDTPANRFLKFSLESFDSICEALIESLNQNSAPKKTECRREAKLMHGMINDILRDRFFDEVGPLDIMPQNNQVLQKRTGYSQLFSAYSMIDLALQLDWKGEGSVYEGESKNVALLYEYWLFFELARVIGSIDGCILEESNENPFIISDKGRLVISLQEGKKSCQSFYIPRLETRINLYYNRTFMPTEFRTTRYEGSYSRQFRPDYTLAVFPARYNKGKNNGESDAISDGMVSFVHFDAKYRITNLAAFIGKEDENADEETYEIEEEKADEIINTYKRGDLLKMHTYNDAIRRTVGSYVLYPGNGSVSDYRKHIFSLYDEILPGVGAFAIKPSISSLGEDELKRFITNLITEKAQYSSRLNRLKYYSEMILREPSSPKTVNSQFIKAGQNTTKLSEELCVIGYMRADKSDDYYNYLKTTGQLRVGAQFYFYYYAIKGSVVYSHHLDITRAGRLLIFTNKIGETDSYQLEPFICRIETNELISKADLVQRLNVQGYMTFEENHPADFYYVMKVTVISELSSKINLKIVDVNAVNGNDSFSSHSPKVLPFDFL